jgi:CMP-N-acetylneuraminic acid synthetase
MRTLAVIPVKIHSERLTRKNFRLVGGETLVGRAVKIARQAKWLGLVDEIAISYDGWDQSFKEYEDIFLHPQQDPKPTRTLECVQEFLQPKHGQWDLFALLLPTSPLRTLRHLVESRLLYDGTVDAVMSMVPFRQDYRYMCFLDSQGKLVLSHAAGWPGDALKHDGTVIWARADWLCRKPKSWYDSLSIVPYLVNPVESVDVNDAVDLLFANTLVDRGKI